MATLEQFQAWIEKSAADLAAHEPHLTDLDRAIGDGDHGSNMRRGFERCAELASEEDFTGIDGYLKRVGMTLVSTVGGAAGPLYGTFFLRMAQPLTASADATVGEVGQALRAGVEGILARGKAEAGDKTIYDALKPALEAFDEQQSAGASVADALQAAARAAARGRDETEPLIARKGRASYLGERSAGHVDPGATSAAILMEAAAASLR